MARTNIKFELKKALEEKASYGRSKHADKVKTQELRYQMQKEGASYDERLKINEMKDHIYSYKTMETYQNQVGYFADYLIEHGHRKISLEESKDYIQEYIDHLSEEGKSPWTINTALSAICKSTGAYIHDYTHPERTVSNIQRSGDAERTHDKYNEKNHSEILQINQLLGLRRSELMKLKASDITTDKDGNVVITLKSKGGRIGEHIFVWEDEKEKVLALKEGKEPNDRIFSRDMFRNDCDLHHQRALRAQHVYDRVVKDMKEHPERRDYYKGIIQKEYEKHGRTCKEILDNPYCARGKNRERLLAEGKEVSYDRVAALFVSCTVLSHTRGDVSIQHYIGR